MEKEKFIELAILVLSNEATLQEKGMFEKFLEDDKYRALFLWTSKEWKQAEVEDDNIDFSLSEGLEKIEKDIRKYDASFSWNEKKSRNLSHRLSTLQIAASIILFIIVSVTSLYTVGFFQKQTNVITMTEKVTKFGQKSILTLFDGTKITLNANSKLKYPNHFGETSREVYLDGEAYFEVVHNTKKPFIVHSGEVSTVVLGTKFNVQAFPNERNIKVSLVTGKVKILNKVKNEANSKFLLKPHEQFVYNKFTGERFINRFEILSEIGWKDNTFIFKNKPLQKVFKNLKRAFGVEFYVASKTKSTNRNIKLTADFKNASFWTVVETIKSVTKLDYNIKFKEKEVIGIEFYCKN